MTVPEHSHGHPCVLIVDDEEDTRETLREIIEMVGCSAIVAENGSEGLKLIVERQPSLVILDLSMPVMTGAEVISTLQKEPELAGVTVVISTSAPELAPPGIPVLKKPMDLDALRGWLRRTCHCFAASQAGPPSAQPA